VNEENQKGLEIKKAGNNPCLTQKPMTAINLGSSR
jgi:hypothetical protein